MRAISGNVCRCTGYESIINAILDAAGDGDEGRRHARPAPRRARPRHRPHAVLRGHQPDRAAASEDAPLRAPSRADHGRHLGRRGGAGRREGAHVRGRAEQLVHDPQAHQRRLRRRAGAGRGQGAVRRRADRRRRGDQRARRARGRGRGAGHLRGPARGVRRRGGGRRRRAGDQAARHELHDLRGLPLPAGALRRRRAGLRRGRPRLRVALPVRADRARADGDHRLHRRAQARRPAEDHLGHAGLLLHARQHGADPRRAVRQAAGRRRDGRRRVRRQGRRDGRADRVHRRDGHQPAGEVRLRPHRGDAGLLPARGRADLHQGRRDERRADRRPAGPPVRRRRRLLAPQPIRRHQGRGAHARAVHDPERLRGLVVRLHEPHAVFGHARVRGDDRRLRARVADGPDRARAGHGPAAAAVDERVPGRRHEGAPQGRRGHGADRGDPEGGRPRRSRPARGVPSDVSSEAR